MPAPRKYTLDKANALVVWLEKTFHEIDSRRARHETAKHELEHLMQQSRGNGHGDIDSKLRAARKVFDESLEQVRELLAAIVEKDIEVRDVEMGLVDFPGERDGKDIWLCWRKGEASITHWHDIDKGFRDRQPL